MASQQQQQGRQLGCSSSSRSSSRCSGRGSCSSGRLLRLVVVCCATFSWFSSSSLCSARRLLPHREQAPHIGPSSFAGARPPPKHIQAAEAPLTGNSTVSTKRSVRSGENSHPGGFDSKLVAAATRHARSPDFSYATEESGARSDDDNDDDAWRGSTDDRVSVEGLSKAALLQRIHELLQRVNQQNILLEAEKSRCAAEVAAVKTEQLRAAAKQMEELGNYSRALRGELAQKYEKESRKFGHEIELLEAEKLHCMKREEECDLRAERWRNVSVQHKAMFAEKQQDLEGEKDAAQALARTWQETAEQMLLYTRAVGPEAKHVRQHFNSSTSAHAPPAVQSEFLDEFSQILDRRLRYERGEQQLEDVQKEQREIAALKLHSNREEHSRLDIESLLK